MPDISDSFMRKQFVHKLEACEEQKHLMTDWEYRFICDLRDRLESRDLVQGLAIDLWNPTSSQWNQLSMLAETYG